MIFPTNSSIFFQSPFVLRLLKGFFSALSEKPGELSTDESATQTGRQFSLETTGSAQLADPMGVF